MRTILLRSALALTPLFFNAHAAPAPAALGRPNIVFILVDDLRWDSLSCMGHPIAKTPNIDRIAKEGALFRNFFVSIPLCSPSRSSFLTGQYAHTTGVTHNGDNTERSMQLVTFPRLLHDAGYETAFIGKWHMGTNDSERPGFDRWISFKGQGVYEDPVINVDGNRSKVNGYITDILTDYAVEFVKQKHEKPFVVYLAHKAIHGPFTAAERHKHLFADAETPITPNHHDTLEGKPAVTSNPANPQPTRGKRRAGRLPPQTIKSLPRHEEIMRKQLAAMAAVDEGVGRLFQALEETKQLDNTVFIFTSDNGYFWGEHGLGDKRWAYEESIRDPLLIRYPKLLKAGTTFKPMVLNIDIAPTALELGGAPVPASIQGRSLVPLFKNPKAPWRKSFLTEYFFERGFPRTPTWQAVQTERWKYIHYTDLEGMDELYDLKSDPYELKNLIKDSSAQTTLEDLKTELAKLLQETGAQ